jgi:site-specific recombinase XerD
VNELESSSTSAIVIRPRGGQPVAWSDVDFSISAETAEELLAAEPANTRRAYDRNWRQFQRWCAPEGRMSLPATPQTLAEYVRQLAHASFAPSTIDQVIGTIRSKHRGAGYKEQPDTFETLKLLRSYRRAWADAGGRARQATPILIPALRAMVKTCDLSTPIGVRDRSLLLTGFNAMCRRSELAGLDILDILAATDEGMAVHIRYSKTDKDAKGARVSVPFGQHAATCAVRATRAWITLLAGHGITEGALYRPVDRHGRIGDEALAAGHASRRLSGKAVSDVVSRRAVLAGLEDPEGYTGHSLRSGAATSAYLGGAPVAEIIKHGRWSPKSPVVLGYIRAVDEWENNPMKGIGL